MHSSTHHGAMGDTGLTVGDIELTADNTELTVGDTELTVGDARRMNVDEPEEDADAGQQDQEDEHREAAAAAVLRAELLHILISGALVAHRVWPPREGGGKSDASLGPGGGTAATDRSGQSGRAARRERAGHRCDGNLA